MIRPGTSIAYHHERIVTCSPRAAGGGGGDEQGECGSGGARWSCPLAMTW